MTLIDFAELSCSRDNWPAQISELHDSLKQCCKGKTSIIIEISGLDSLGAAILFRESVKNPIFIPTLAVIPTEYGDMNTVISQAERVLKKRLKDAFITPFVILRDLRLWSILNGRYIPSIIQEFGFYSPCIGCHLYVHVLRIALAKIIGAKVIVTGERLKHNGKLKINQTSTSLSSHEQFCKEYGILLKLPLKEVYEGEEVRSIVNHPYEKDAELRCIFRSNLYDKKGSAFNINKLDHYYCKFTIPVARAYIELLTACWDGTIEPHGDRELYNMIEKSIFLDTNPC